MEDVTKAELEQIVLRALFDFIQSSSGFLSAERVAFLLEGRFTEARIGMALRALEQARFVRARHNAMTGSSYEISDAGYEAVEEDRLAQKDKTPEPNVVEDSQLISSESWTGRESMRLQEDDRKSRLLQLLDEAKIKLPTLGLSNENSAQGLAYIQAITALTDAPDPPEDLIWEMIGRASKIAGIAALFVSIIGLFH